ncbi:hypothetical protein EVAR_85525_1 [Eumeta japonica]|uniref:Uncharacterized protein n=1 Tax=Eumeta variegata TaxID=151549 RepID=A0A4C1VDC9_EUMVA|nr:hypothetical protein EVAR_85525_1 [Eumeta japonica]
MDRVLMQRRIMQPLGCSPSMMELFNSEQQRLETFHKNCSDDGLVSLYIRRRYSREGYLLKSCSSTVNNTDLKLSIQTVLTMDRVLMQQRIMQPLGCSPSMMKLFNSEQQRLETFHKNCSDDGLVSLYIRRRYSREGFLLR